LQQKICKLLFLLHTNIFSEFILLEIPGLAILQKSLQNKRIPFLAPRLLKQLLLTHIALSADIY